MLDFSSLTKAVASLAEALDAAKARPADLNLALEGPALPLEKAFALRDALSESDLPMRVDVISAADIP